MKELAGFVAFIMVMWTLSAGPVEVASKLHDAWKALIGGHPTVVEQQQKVEPPKPPKVFKND